MAPDRPVLTELVVVDPGVMDDGRCATMLDRLQDCLRGHFDVEHSTLQLEPAGHADRERPVHDRAAAGRVSAPGERPY